MQKFKIEIQDDFITQKGIEATIDFYHTIAIEEFILPGLNAFATWVNSPFLNVLIDTSSGNEINSIVINSLTHFFNSHRAPWGWFVTPNSSPAAIKQHGFVLLDKSPGMYFDLSGDFPENLGGLIEIQEVEGDLHDWIEPIQDGFPSDDDGESYRVLNAKLLARKEKKLRHYVAYYQNQIAAAATLFVSKDAVMLHNLATKKRFKKLGIGTALTLHLMSIAKKMGQKHCFLDSSDEGLNLYKRIGFQIYSIVDIYHNPKEL